MITMAFARSRSITPFLIQFLRSVLVVAGCMIAGTTYGQEPLIRDSVANHNQDFHFQFTTVTQRKSSIRSPYSGPRSLLPGAETASTLTATIFYGRPLWKNAAVYFNPEIAGGSGISGAQGIGGFTNGEAFRVGEPAPSIYVARLFFQQTIALSDEMVDVGLGANDVHKLKPARYLDIVAGKFSVADYFDRNSYSHDPRSQFLNWSLMSTGAWDYPANVRGYTWGGVLELGLKNYSIRAAATMLPLEANGNDLNRKISKAYGTMIELERRFRVSDRNGVIRILTFYNRANMGDYRLAVSSSNGTPDVVSTREYGRDKYGFSVNTELELSRYVGAFARASWNDGNHETWAFTEIDRSVSGGLDFDGAAWKRREDRIGLAIAMNGISVPHRDYLKAGGSGFILGDGTLNYGREMIAEIYYRANLFSEAFYLTPDLQAVINPGYNRSRGPAFFAALRVHFEF